MPHPERAAYLLMSRLVNSTSTTSKALLMGKLWEEILRLPEIRLGHADLTKEDVMVFTLKNDHRSADPQFEAEFALLCTRNGLATFAKMIDGYLASTSEDLALDGPESWRFGEQNENLK